VNASGLLPVASVVVFAALLFMIGAATERVLPGRGPSDPDELRLRRASGTLGAVAGVLLTAGLLASFAAQLLAFNFPGDPLIPDVRLLLAQPWGRAWSAVLLLALLATGGFIRLRARAGGAAEAATILVVVVLAFGPAATGHAAGEASRVLAVTLDGLHVLAAGSWLGTLAVLVATAPLGTGGGAGLARRIRRFSPVALLAAPVVVGTGIASGWLRLAGASDLWSSVYVRLLAFKLALFLGVLGLGFYNWRTAAKRLDRSGALRPAEASLVGELLLALAILAVTAVLVNSPLPAR
jgi:putative copper resistance protein D